MNLVLNSPMSVTALLSAVFTVGLASGCNADNKDRAPTTKPARLAERTDKAIEDPFGYSPSFDRTDISGGDVGTMDKDGLRRDVDRVLNP
jgi:uncharacterized protein YijF (DUF1287 family)